jgi:hypothetical protein
MRVKGIILIVISSFIVGSINGQDSPAPGSTIYSPELNKFVGTWKYKCGNDELIFVLEKQAVNTPSPSNLTLENIVGWHKWTENGVVKQGTLAYVGSPYSLHKHTIAGFYQTLNNGYTLQGSFIDNTKDKRCDFLLTMTDGSFTQMTLTLKESPGLKPHGFQWGFSIPANAVLVKQ